MDVPVTVVVDVWPICQLMEEPNTPYVDVPWSMYFVFRTCQRDVGREPRNA